MALRLYNTLGRSLQPFEPLKPGSVGFYGCGPTVYNFAHIGNLRAYVVDDVIARSLRYLGYDVTHVMNITDVGHLSGDDDSGEDKMVKSAVERGESVLEVARYYTDAFFADSSALNIQRPSVVCRRRPYRQPVRPPAAMKSMALPTPLVAICTSMYQSSPATVILPCSGWMATIWAV
ncbi:hypothetical protein MASR2M48_30290 [Spirochaetota bacterium]